MDAVPKFISWVPIFAKRCKAVEFERGMREFIFSIFPLLQKGSRGS